MWEIDPVPDQMVLEFRRGVATPVQGLAIKLEGGILCANDVEARHLTLWLDTAPKEVCLLITKKKKKARLMIWNIWRDTIDGRDITQAWLGNSGMRIELSGEGNETILRCSDGVGPVNFDDLIVGARMKSAV
ncbi:hypothetical protein ASD89_02960 [Caulobacter sp. Root656]|nr:hypothetical protein ASD89_02960 [Caulobacter sp. Root656]